MLKNKVKLYLIEVFNHDVKIKPCPKVNGVEELLTYVHKDALHFDVQSASSEVEALFLSYKAFVLKMDKAIQKVNQLKKQLRALEVFKERMEKENGLSRFFHRTRRRALI